MYRPVAWRPLVPLLAAGSECCTRETSPPIAPGCEVWSPLALLSFAEDLRSESWPPPTSCLHQQMFLYVLFVRKCFCWANGTKNSPSVFTTVFGNTEKKGEACDAF